MAELLIGFSYIGEKGGSMKEILDALQVADKRYRTELIKMAKAQSITVAEWTLLETLQIGFDTQDKLAKKMRLDNSTLSRQLKSLVNKDMVMCEAISRDNRQLRYQLSKQGLHTIHELEAAQMRFNQTVFSVWSDEEQRMMAILLNRLGKSLTKIA